MKNNKILVFDMDGTIADLYNYPNWLDCILNEDEKPYRYAKPLVDMVKLRNILIALKEYNWQIMVTSWLAKGATDRYNKAVVAAKEQWLLKQNFPFDNLFVVEYGQNKTKSTKNYGGYQILIDDNASVREDWDLGSTIDANSNFIEELIGILKREVKNEST